LIIEARRISCRWEKTHSAMVPALKTPNQPMCVNSHKLAGLCFPISEVSAANYCDIPVPRHDPDQCLQSSSSSKRGFSHLFLHQTFSVRGGFVLLHDAPLQTVLAYTTGHVHRAGRHTRLPRPRKQCREIRSLSGRWR
jgi:hypothetical protein